MSSHVTLIVIVALAVPPPFPDAKPVTVVAVLGLSVGVSPQGHVALPAVGAGTEQTTVDRPARAARTLHGDVATERGRSRRAALWGTHMPVCACAVYEITRGRSRRRRQRHAAICTALRRSMDGATCASPPRPRAGHAFTATVRRRVAVSRTLPTSTAHAPSVSHAPTSSLPVLGIGRADPARSGASVAAGG